MGAGTSAPPEFLELPEPPDIAQEIAGLLGPDDDVDAILAHLTLREQEELWALLNGRTRRPLSFREFVSHVHPRFQWYWHNVILANVLQRVADGELTRVMVFMPPRHGKSELISRLFPAYYLYRFPDRFVGLSSYGQGLADKLSRAARGFYRATGRNSPGNADAVQYWETGKGGGLWAAGAGGTQAGLGYHLGIIDDPTKNAKEAQSKQVQENQIDWFDAVYNTRAEPGAAIVLVSTRWDIHDLPGQLLEQEAAAAAEPEWSHPERWHIVNFLAIREEDEPHRFPPTCTVEPDSRPVGAPLCPERYPLKRLEQIKHRNAYYWAALFQQRPTLREGHLIKLGWFEGKRMSPYALPAADGQEVRYWDTASTQEGGDYSVGTRVRRVKHPIAPRYIVLDVVRGQWDPGTRDSVMRTTAKNDGPTVQQWLAQEPGSGGKDQALRFVGLMAPYPAYTESPTGDKVVRADGYMAQLAGGNVYYVEAHWNQAWIDEQTSFRGHPADVDDQVDTVAGAFNRLARMIGSAPGDFRTVKT